MFTIKLYGENGSRQRILAAESFTILRDQYGGAEITLHQKNGAEDSRVDVGSGYSAVGTPPTYHRAIIENSAGKTTEFIECRPVECTPSAGVLGRQIGGGINNAVAA